MFDMKADAQLAEIVDKLLEQSRQGRCPDLSVVISQHPQWESELRDLYATLLLVEDASSCVFVRQDSSSRETLEENSFPNSPAQLPREFGDYVLLQELGRGGMGVVYKAWQKSLRRLVALKMILRQQLATADDLARFRAEAEAAARVHHPQIVTVYEVGELHGQPYFSMQYVEGTTLARVISEGPISSRRAAKLLIPICRAISTAHRHGVLHRDLKPSNILIDKEERTFVTDFGLAKRLRSDDHAGINAPLPESLTYSGAIVGTPGYMAPELAAGQKTAIGPATDVYSLGAILYAMLTGRPPFQASNPLDTVFMVVEQDPLPPRMLNPHADPDLEMIALKCLQKPADLRYPSADALADDLEAFLANEPVSARSSNILLILSRAFRETHHAAILENWGLLWMWHSLVVFVMCLITTFMQHGGVTSRWPYVLFWTVGVGTWALIFWELRKRSGPITFVERQIAHIWASSSIASTLLFFVEELMQLPVLKLSPVLPLFAGSVFLVKAGILSGSFYGQALVLYACSLIMAHWQHWPRYNYGVALFGAILGACFFLPGWKYWRQRIKNMSNNRGITAELKS